MYCEINLQDLKKAKGITIKKVNPFLIDDIENLENYISLYKQFYQIDKIHFSLKNIKIMNKILKRKYKELIKQTKLNRIYLLNINS